MEPKTSAQSVNTNNEDEHDVSNLIDDFVVLDIKKEELVDNATIVFFGIDRTDRNTKICEILAIAAACRGNNGAINEFKINMIPEKYGITPSTSVNKGYKMGTDGKLLIGENEVEATTQKQGLEKFLKFLSDQSGGTRSVLLATHACDKNRRPVLLRHMAEYNLLPVCKNLVVGFIDTCTVIERRLQQLYGLANNNDTDFSLKNLAKTYLRLNILRERADVSVQAIMSLIDCPAINCTDAMLVDCATAFNFDAYILLVDLQRDFQPAQVDFEVTHVVITDVRPAFVQNQVSLRILKKIAFAGISSAMLQNEYGVTGDVSNFLRAVTKKPAVIQSINARLLAMTNPN